MRFPEKVRRAAPIAGTAKNTPHDFLYTDTLMTAIKSDPGFKNGFYDSNEEVREGLARHAKIWTVMGFSTEFLNGSTGTRWVLRRWRTSRSDSWRRTSTP